MSLESLSTKLYTKYTSFVSSYKKNTYIVFLSASDMISRAIVRHAVSNDPDDAYLKAYDLLKSACNEHDVHPIILRLDLVNTRTTMTWKVLSSKIINTPRSQFRLGISFDPDYKIALTECEINAYCILYDRRENKNDNCIFREDNLINYCKEILNTSSPAIDDNNDVETFTTVGLYVYNDDSEASLIRNKDTVDISNIDNIKHMISSGCKYLTSQILQDGKFIYGKYAPYNTSINFYESLRPLGATYAILDTYDIISEEADKETILYQTKLAIDYSIENYIIYNESKSIAYVYDNSSYGFLIGGSGLALLALCKYMNITNDTSYLPLANAIANGIIASQNDDGTFNQLIDSDSYSVKKKFVLPIFDGESLFGLIRLYEITKSDIIMNTIIKAVDNMISCNYWNNHDHWLSYALNELVTYKPEYKYFKLAIYNILDRIPIMCKNNPNLYFSSIELITAFKLLLSKLYKTPNTEDLRKLINISDLNEAINNLIKTIAIDQFIYPELAIYYRVPGNVVNAFHYRRMNSRIQIDDVQHTISGLMNYIKSLDESYSIENTNLRQQQSVIDIQDSSNLIQINPEPPITVGILRNYRSKLKSKFLNVNTSPFYTAKQFNIDIYEFTPNDINFSNKTVLGITLDSNGIEISKTIPIPKIIDNQIMFGENGEKTKLLEKDSILLRHPLYNSNKQKVHDKMVADNKFTELIIPTHTMTEDIDLFLDLLQKYNNHVIIKPNNGNRGRNIIDIIYTIDNIYEVSINDVTTTYTITNFINFYNDRIHEEQYILQPYIKSKTRDNHPFGTRIHAVRGSMGKFNIFYYAWIGDNYNINANMCQGGYPRWLDDFLKLEFPDDWKDIYDRYIYYGNNIPEYYSSLYDHPLFDIGIDMGIQKISDHNYELKIFELNTYIETTDLFRIEDTITRFNYYKHIYNTRIK